MAKRTGKIVLEYTMLEVIAMVVEQIGARENVRIQESLYDSEGDKFTFTGTITVGVEKKLEVFKKPDVKTRKQGLKKAIEDLILDGKQWNAINLSEKVNALGFRTSAAHMRRYLENMPVTEVRNNTWQINK